MDSNKIIVTILVFVLLSTSVLADFSFTQGKGIDPLCPRATGLFTDYVKNIGAESGFTVNVDGSEAASWSTSTPAGFILQQGGDKVIYTYVTPVEAAKTGTYNLDVIVTQNGVTKKISHAVNVKECYSAGLTLTEKSKALCAGNDVKYEFVLKNTGFYEEVYALSVGGSAKDFVTLSETSLVLKIGEQKSIFAYAKVSSAEKPGTKQFTLTAKGQSVNGAIENAEAIVVINDCYAFTALPEKNSYEMCDASSLSIPVTVKNTGTSSNSYTLDIRNAPAWLSIDKKTVELSAGQSGAANINLKPEYKVAGNFDLKLEVIPKDGKEKAISTIGVKVKSCHGVKLDIVKSDDVLCASESGKYEILVENSGEVNKEYAIETNKGELSESRLSLTPKQKKTIYLTVNTGENQSTNTEDIKAEAKSLDESKVNYADTLKLTVKSVVDCYKPEVILHNKDIVVYYDSAAAVEVDVKNKGIRTARYNLALSGTGVDFMQIAPASITVEPGKSEKAAVYIAPNIKDGEFKVDVTASIKDSVVLASDSLKLRITKNKDEATKGITGKSIGDVSNKISLWQRIKNWIKSKFGKQEPVKEENLSNKTKIVVINQTKPVNKSAVRNETIVKTAVKNETVKVNTTQILPKLSSPNTTANKTTPLDLLNFKPVANEQMKVNDMFGFSINGEQHSVKLDKIANKTITLTFSSTPVKVDLKVGESKDVDLNNDGTKDVKVTLNGFVDGKADITYELIKKQNGVSIGNIYNKILDYKNYIIVGIIILILLILISKYKKQIGEFFEEEDVKPAETPKAEEKKVETKTEHKKEEKHKK